MPCLEYWHFKPWLQPGDYVHNNKVKKALAVKELNAKAAKNAEKVKHRAKTPVKKE